ncbi:hypothetical protein GH5_06825 [Leishmania sp. Ghana 2012 LV757]|uniref:hypothetical protein n=1 Tax=Leishmania sp. Ghana 2012 LV757 TaxID=2803181 RepID=UPI001B745A37|nr:hypothetical protein GH5_06825 [Leishmania sp. Ghana 2012 LV757]
MSHGRRMLEAQAQKERTSGTREDGRVDDGHLRNGSRALNDDGTPVRLSRNSLRASGGERGRDDGDGDTALVSPPPRPSVRLGLGHAGDGRSSANSAATPAGSADAGDFTETPNRQPRISGIVPSPVAAFSYTPLTVPRRPQSSEVAESVRVSTALHIDVDAEDREADNNGKETRGTVADGTVRGSPRPRGGHARGDSLACASSAQRGVSSEARSRSRTSGSGFRYPASRVSILASTSTPSASPYDPPSPLTRSRTGSRSPPPMTAAQMASASLSPSHQRRAAPLPAPITAALLRPNNAELRAGSTPAAGTAAAVTHASRRQPLLRPESSSCSAGSTGFTMAAAALSRKASPLPMLVPPASPPLRAGVSPRMPPLHPTRADASNASLRISRATSASTVATTVATTPSPCELQQPQPQPHLMPSAPLVMSAADMPSLLVQSRNISDLAGDAAEREPQSVLCSPPTLSQKSEPGPVTAGPEWRSAPPSPLPTSSEPPAGPRLPLLPEATLPYDDGSATPLINSVDIRVYPFMRDFSGFHNTGNDCYGCSLLTMLLRSTVFRRALLGSPFVCAMRRYEALLTGRAERRVLWTSGYVDSTAEVKAKKAARKRAWAPGQPAEEGDGSAQAEDSSVAGLCGSADPTPRGPTERLAPSQYVLRPTKAVQHTLNVLGTFSLEELEDVLEVDLETQRVPATLHSALAALARAQRWREHLTTLVNTPRTQSGERQRLLETKIFHDSDRDFDGQVYTNGIRLTAVANLFDGEFFLGDQEDTHELFVAIMAKLETEAVRLQQRCDEVLERRSPLSLRNESSAEDEGDEESVPNDRRGRDGRGASLAEERLPHATCATSASPTVPSDVLAAATVVAASHAPAERRLSVSMAAAEVWINTLLQTRLLNIIRCRTAECRHEIVTDEVCVNLSVHIPEEPVASLPPAPALPLPSYFPALPPPLPPTSISPSSSAAVAVAASTLSAVEGEGGRCHSLAHLLHDSMAYEALNEYRCDGCGSRTSQFQGGCFYTRPPPLLVLQLKRFSTQFVNGIVIIQKNGREVAVEDTLVIRALPSAGELRAWQRRQGRQPHGNPGGVEHSVVAEGEQGAVAGRSASPTASATTSSACESRACGFYYDPDKKCFSAALQDAYHLSGGGEPAGRENRNDGRHHGTGGDSPATTAAADTSSFRVWAIQCVYALRSCVLHLGQSLHYGHYVSDFAVDGEEDDEDTETAGGRRTTEAKACIGANSQTPQNPFGAARRRWRRANDERVEVLSEEVVRARRAGCSDTYLLLYEKVAEEWVRCPAEAVLPTPVYRSAEEGKTRNEVEGSSQSQEAQRK